MHRLSVITDEVSQDLVEVMAFARRNGMTGLEPRSVNGHGPFEWDEADIAAIDVARAAGFAIPCLGLPFGKCHWNDAAEVRRHLDALETWIALAHRWETRLIRGFTFWKEEGSREAALALYRGLVPRLRQEGLTVVLETEPSVSTRNASSLARFLEEVDAPEVAALWDPGNLPFDPEGERPFPEGYACLRGRIAHVHLKDAAGCGETARAVCPGTGLVDFPGQLTALERDGYAGYLSLETHYRLNTQLSEEELRLPGGAAFSNGGMAASQQAMDALKKWL